MSSNADPNIPFEQGKTYCMLILSYPSCLYHFMLEIYCALMYQNFYNNLAALRLLFHIINVTFVVYATIRCVMLSSS
jgi:hypothetical protein